MRYKFPAYDHYLVAVDPGVHYCGVAVGLVTPGPETTLVAAFTIPSSKVRSYIGRTTKGIPCVWVFERPQKYAHRSSTHKDLDRLDKVLKSLPKPAARWYPRQWKGNVPKAVHHDRIRKYLDPAELEGTEELDHNAWDAVALWLYAVGRTGRGGTKP